MEGNLLEGVGLGRRSDPLFGAGQLVSGDAGPLVGRSLTQVILSRCELPLTC